MSEETTAPTPAPTPEPTLQDPKVSQAQLVAKLASNPVALVAYAMLSGTFGGVFVAPELAEDFDAHTHEEEKLPELRRHWTSDERRRLEERLSKLEAPSDRPLEDRLQKLEVEIGAAVRLLELNQNRRDQ